MVWWLAAATPCLFKCILSVLIQSVIMVVLTRSECNQARFKAVCNGNTMVLLANESTTRITTISCSTPTWIYAPDDGSPFRRLNTSNSKYTVVGGNLEIDLTDFSGSDEGIYGCNQINEAPFTIEQCIQVYGRAVFASCPRELMGCTENETLCVPADGGSVSFDATVTHIHGGSCGFLQNIDLIKLRKLNETTEQFKPLFICKSEYNWQCMPSSTRSRESLNLNLTRGSTGFEFTLTLFNVTTDNVGMYKVIVEKSRPSSGGTEYLKKIFHLFVEPTTDCTLCYRPHNRFGLRLKSKP